MAKQLMSQGNRKLAVRESPPLRQILYFPSNSPWYGPRPLWPTQTNLSPDASCLQTSRRQF